MISSKVRRSCTSRFSSLSMRVLSSSNWMVPNFCSSIICCQGSFIYCEKSWKKRLICLYWEKSYLFLCSTVNSCRSWVEVESVFWIFIRWSSVLILASFVYTVLWEILNASPIWSLETLIFLFLQTWYSAPDASAIGFPPVLRILMSVSSASTSNVVSFVIFPPQSKR